MTVPERDMLDGSLLEHQNKLLVELARSAALRGDDLDAGLELITRMVAEELGVHRTSAWRLDPVADRLVCLKLYDGESERFEQGAILKASDYNDYFEALRFGRYIDASAARFDPRTAQFLESYLVPLDIHSMLDATIRRGGQVAGVVCCEHKYRPRDWSLEERILVGGIADLVSLFFEHTEVVAAREALDASKVRYERLFLSAQDALVILHGDDVIEFNSSAEELFGGESRLLNRRFTDLVVGSEEGEDLGEVLTGIQDGSERLECKLRRRRHSERDLELSLDPFRIQDEWFTLVWLRDITESKQQQARIEYQAYHDSITGLPNRNALARFLDECLDAERLAPRLAVLLLDLDRFKEVNDTLGHTIGDSVLKVIGERIQGELESSDSFLCRIGGDEFVAVVGGPQTVTIEAFARDLGASLAEPVPLDDLNLEVGCSIGISMCPDHASDLGELLRTAEVAMYQAKSDATGVRVYEPQMDPYTVDRLSLMMDLRKALRNKELYLDYQRKIDLASGASVGCEALARWTDPERGDIPPNRFVPLAELSGLIAALTENVIQLACRQITSWEREGLRIPVAVNLSVRNLMDPVFPRTVKSALLAENVNPGRLEFEITESSMMQDLHRCERTLRELNALGLKITIDDFGTGYSSMTYLQRLPVHQLKIDRSFVVRVVRSERNRTIVRTIIDLGHNLGLLVTAEGIESDETLEILRKMGCDFGQGYHIGRPEPPKSLAASFAAHPF